MKGGWLRQDGQQTKPESAVFLAANQSPVLWRVAHKKQSGKRVTRYFPVCRGCRGKGTRGTRDCSRSTDERLNTTVWPNRPSGPQYVYGHMSTHVWREEDRDRGRGQSLSLSIIWACPEKFDLENFFVHSNRNVNNFVGIFSVHSAVHQILSW